MPGSTMLKAFVMFVALWAPFSQANTGWQPIQETIRKSDKDTRQYQAIEIDKLHALRYADSVSMMLSWQR
jgi:protease-3